MNTQLTKLNKRISELVMELQAIDQKADGLIHQRWQVEKQIQQLLRGDDEIPEAQVVERRTVEAAGRHH